MGDGGGKRKRARQGPIRAHSRCPVSWLEMSAANRCHGGRRFYHETVNLRPTACGGCKLNGVQLEAFARSTKVSSDVSLSPTCRNTGSVPIIVSNRFSCGFSRS